MKTTKKKIRNIFYSRNIFYISDIYRNIFDDGNIGNGKSEIYYVIFESELFRMRAGRENIYSQRNIFQIILKLKRI